MKHTMMKVLSVVMALTMIMGTFGMPPSVSMKTVPKPRFRLRVVHTAIRCMSVRIADILMPLI